MRYKLIYISILFAFFFGFFSRSVNAMYVSPQSNVVNPFGIVRASLRDDTLTYVGGTIKGKDYTTGAMITFNPSSDTYRSFNLEGFTTTSTDANVAISDGNGGWYIGGAFKEYNDVFIDGVGTTGYALIHVNAADAVVGYWIPTSSATNRIMSLMVDGDYLYAGGRYTWTDGNSVVHSNIVRLNTTTGILDTSMTLTVTGTSSYVRTITSDSTHIYFGGLFTAVNGTTITNKYSNFRVLKSDVNTRDTAWGISFTSTTKAILKMVHVADGIIVSTNTAVSTYDYLMKVDKNTGALMTWISTTAISSTSPIYDFIVDGSYVYITGNLVSVGGYTNKDVLRLNLADGTIDTTWIPNTIHDAFVTHQGLGIAKNNGVLYAYGTFVTGTSIYKYLIAIDESTAEVSDPVSTKIFSSPYNPNPTTHPPALSSSGSSLVIYSEKQLSISAYTNYDKRLFRYTTATGIIDNDWNPVISYSAGTPVVRKILSYGSNSLLIFGQFDSVGGLTRVNMAKINKTTGAVDPDFVFNVATSSTTSGGIYDAIIVGDNLYIGGFFTDVNGTPRISTAKINLFTNTLDTDWVVDSDDVVYKLIHDSGNIYLAGNFSNLGVINREALARVSATDGTVDATWIANAGNQVSALAVDDTGVYVGGTFLTINSLPMVRFGRLSKTDAAIDPDWDFGVNGQVDNIEFVGDHVYISGNMTTVGSLAQPYIARIIKATGTPDDTFTPSVTGRVLVMKKFDDGLMYSSGTGEKLSIFHTPVLYQINNLSASLDAKKATDNSNIEIGASDGLNTASSVVRLAKSDVIIADVTTDMRSDRDWSTVTADIDVLTGKSFVHNLNSAPGASSSYTLYIPVLNDDTSVTICPNATSISDVSTSCTNSITFSENETKSVTFPSGSGSVTVTKSLISGQNYWVAAGVKGTGGISGSGNGGGATPTPTSTASSSSSLSTTTTSESSPEQCNSISPESVSPWIHSATALNSDSVLISFINWNLIKDKFILEYGIKPNEYIYSANDISLNSNSYIVKNLAADTTYYFRIRASNGCAVGPWSNEISAKTNSHFEVNKITIVNSNLEAKENISKNSKVKYNNEEKYTVNVIVQDIDGKPIKNAKITLHSEPRESTTNDDGIAKFIDVEEGDHKIFIDYKKYKGEQALNLSGDTKIINLHVTIVANEVMFSDVAIWIISISILIILILIILLIKEKRKKSKDHHYMIK